MGTRGVNEIRRWIWVIHYVADLLMRRRRLLRDEKKLKHTVFFVYVRRW